MDNFVPSLRMEVELNLLIFMKMFIDCFKYTSLLTKSFGKMEFDAKAFSALFYLFRSFLGGNKLSKVYINFYDPQFCEISPLLLKL